VHDDEEPRWVPVELGPLREAADSAGAARDDLRRAIDALLEQAEDFSIDAARRLRERGASGAQVEAYERAYVDRRDAVRAASRALDAALERWRALTSDAPR